MVFKNAPSLLSSAVQYGLKNPKLVRAGLGYAKEAYDYLTTPSKPRSIRRKAPQSRVIAVYKPRVVRPYRAKANYRATVKKRKINKLVGPPAKTYNVKSKRMRRNNKGTLSLQDRLQSGKSLPNVTFARLFWRGSGNVAFQGVGKEAINRPNGLNDLYYTLNDITNSPSWSYQTNLNHGVTYAPLWQSLYREYMVYGAKINFKISPTILSDFKSNLPNPTPNTGTDSSVPANAQPGYWYVRAYYHRNPTVTTPEPVGDFMDRSPSNDLGRENHWPNLRSFLSDPTVTYKKDTTVVRTQLQIQAPYGLTTSGGTNIQGTIPTIPSATTTTVIESSTKPVTLSVNYSAKKHHSVMNPAQDLNWNNFATSPNEISSFSVRIGYIGFHNDGTVAYHSPIDRNFKRFVETEVQYFVSFRGPKIDPHDSAISSARFSPTYNLDFDSLDVQEELPDTDDYVAEII